MAKTSALRKKANSNKKKKSLYDLTLEGSKEAAKIIKTIEKR